MKNPPDAAGAPGGYETGLQRAYCRACTSKLLIGSVENTTSLGMPAAAQPVGRSIKT
jgi:hypothetical protein